MKEISSEDIFERIFYTVTEQLMMKNLPDVD
jgi:hypothetical protein